MIFQEYWDKQIKRLESSGIGPAGMNKFYEECYSAWNAAIESREENSNSGKERQPVGETNTGSPKLPSVHECIYQSVTADSTEDNFQHDCEIVRRCYQYILNWQRSGDA